MEYQIKKQILITYLNYYLSKKDLRMKDVRRNIKKRIQSDRPISIRQYNSIIKFLEKEKRFKTSNREEIYRFFEPLIETKRRVIKNDNHHTLTEHFV